MAGRIESSKRRWKKLIKKEDKAVEEEKDETKNVEKQGDGTVEVAG